jgi:hypothetical protein
VKIGLGRVLGDMTDHPHAIAERRRKVLAARNAVFELLAYAPVDNLAMEWRFKGAGIGRHLA